MGHFYKMVIIALTAASLGSCDESTQSADTKKPSSAIGTRPYNYGGGDRYYDRSGDTGNSFYNQIRSCSSYSAMDCSMRGCDLLTSGCSTRGMFSGSCQQYADQSTCGTYASYGCTWNPNGGQGQNGQINPYNQPINGYNQSINGYNQSINGYNQSINGYNQSTNNYSQMGICVSGQPGTMPWMNGQIPPNQQPRFNGLAAIGSVLQCVGGAANCGGNIIGILGSAITAGSQPQFYGQGLPMGGGYQYQPGIYPNPGGYQVNPLYRQ